MDILLRFIADHLAFLLVDNHYRIINSIAHSPYGDGALVLESNAVRLRFVQEHEKLYVDVQPVLEGHDEWFGLGVARRHFFGQRQSNDKLDKSAVDFIRTNLAEIEDAWARSEDRLVGISLLRHEKRARADEMFGPLPPQ